MTQFMKYLRLEYRRSFRVLCNTIASTLFLLLLLCSFTLVISKVLLHTTPFQPAKLAVVIEEGDSAKLTKKIAGFAEAMDTVEELCEFVYTSEADALSGIMDGSYVAAVFLPDDLYQDLYTGTNSPLTILMPDYASLNRQVVAGLFRDAVELIQTSETGVYATISYLSDTNSSVNISDASDAMAYMYFVAIMNRSALFNRQLATATGEYPVIDYYIGSAFLLLMLLSCFHFSSLYQQQTQAFQDKLCAAGLNRYAQGLVHFLVMTISLFIYSQLLNLVLIAVLQIPLGVEAHIAFANPLGMLFLCACLACIMHIAFSLTRDNTHSLIVCILVLMLLLLLSGVFVPTAFLPAAISKLSRIIPFSRLHAYLLSLLF